MEGISKNYVVVQEQPKKKGGKVHKHTVNAAVTAAGLGTVAVGYNKMQNVYSDFLVNGFHSTPVSGNKNILTKLKNYFASMGSKLSMGFETFGEIVFSHPKLNLRFKHHVKRYFPETRNNYKKFAEHLKICKTHSAIVLSAVLASLGIVGAGIYKAGKINGENK